MCVKGWVLEVRMWSRVGRSRVGGEQMELGRGKASRAGSTKVSCTLFLPPTPHVPGTLPHSLPPTLHFPPSPSFSAQGAGEGEDERKAHGVSSKPGREWRQGAITLAITLNPTQISLGSDSGGFSAHHVNPSSHIEASSGGKYLGLGRNCIIQHQH